jgi:hypothetical protein
MDQKPPKHRIALKLRGPRRLRGALLILASGAAITALLNVTDLLQLLGLEWPKWSVIVEPQIGTLDPKRVVGVPFLLVNAGNKGLVDVDSHCVISFEAAAPYWVKVEPIQVDTVPGQFAELPEGSKEPFRCHDFAGVESHMPLTKARVEVAVVYRPNWWPWPRFYRQRFQGLIDAEGRARFYPSGKAETGWGGGTQPKR